MEENASILFKKYVIFYYINYLDSMLIFWQQFTRIYSIANGHDDLTFTLSPSYKLYPSGRVPYGTESSRKPGPRSFCAGDHTIPLQADFYA